MGRRRLCGAAGGEEKVDVEVGRCTRPSSLLARELNTLISFCPVHSCQVGSYLVDSNITSERTLRQLCPSEHELLSRSMRKCSVPPTRTPCLSLSSIGEGELRSIHELRHGGWTEPYEAETIRNGSAYPTTRCLSVLRCSA